MKTWSRSVALQVNEVNVKAECKQDPAKPQANFMGGHRGHRARGHTWAGHAEIYILKGQSVQLPDDSYPQNGRAAVVSHAEGFHSFTLFDGHPSAAFEGLVHQECWEW